MTTTSTSNPLRTREIPDDQRFFNRDLSWLEFNRRVLAQAADESMPLLERVRFLAIFTSNLDEFFMKRVGLVKRQIWAGLDTLSPDGLTPRQQLAHIRESVADLTQQQAKIYNESVLPALTRADIHILSYAELSGKDRAWVDDWYKQNIFPALTPLAVDPTHKFPFISNLSENLAIVAHTARPGEQPVPAARRGANGRANANNRPLERNPDNLFARLKFPPTIQHFIPVPGRGRSADKALRFVVLQDLIRNNLDDLFAGMAIDQQVTFRVTRSAGIQKDDLDTANLLQSIEADLKQRRFARVVRMEIEPDAPPQLLRWLQDKLSLDNSDVYERPSNVDFLALLELADLDRPDLKHKPWKGVVPYRLKPTVLSSSSEKASAAFFAAIRKQDIIFHHPYESFNASVERFIAAAASDPDVLTIKQTLYRTTPDSPFIENLVRAAENGKQVACLVELRARFDEGRNVRFARQLEKAGVHVAYGVAGLKTHCKTSLVVRKERHGLRCYAHFGTGNYHPKTAQLYTDLGILTSDPELTHDLVNLFNFLTGLVATQSYSSLLVAPFNMRAKFNAMIDREMEFARRGKPARIIAKINSLEDRDVTERLYAASQAGVHITLICRGFCCLRPGVPGLSDNIRVISVVGRFLEHSRIFHFAAGQEDPCDGDWFIASADWMYRNLSNRVEVGVPVHDRSARERLNRIINVHLADQRCAWDLTPTGDYTRRTPSNLVTPDSPEAIGTFETLMRDATTGGEL
ncbi:MAG TPA: polyphosphate kinase 1 [Phycisphaerales bacterium]|nr:polyphosphate kinase 1 [Phycisphaerales bacterium]